MYAHAYIHKIVKSPNYSSLGENSIMVTPMTVVTPTKVSKIYRTRILSLAKLRIDLHPHAFRLRGILVMLNAVDLELAL